jgi:hypothetical protein
MTEAKTNAALAKAFFQSKDSIAGQLVALAEQGNVPNKADREAIINQASVAAESGLADIKAIISLLKERFESISTEPFLVAANVTKDAFAYSLFDLTPAVTELRSWLLEEYSYDLVSLRRLEPDVREGRGRGQVAVEVKWNGHQTFWAMVQSKMHHAAMLRVFDEITAAAASEGASPLNWFRQNHDTAEAQMVEDILAGVNPTGYLTGRVGSINESLTQHELLKRSSQLMEQSHAVTGAFFTASQFDEVTPEDEVTWDHIAAAAKSIDDAVDEYFGIINSLIAVMEGNPEKIEALKEDRTALFAVTERMATLVKTVDDIDNKFHTSLGQDYRDEVKDEKLLGLGGPGALFTLSAWRSLSREKEFRRVYDSHPEKLNLNLLQFSSARIEKAAKDELAAAEEEDKKAEATRMADAKRAETQRRHDEKKAAKERAAVQKKAAKEAADAKKRAIDEEAQTKEQAEGLTGGDPENSRNSSASANQLESRSPNPLWRKLHWVSIALMAPSTLIYGLTETGTDPDYTTTVAVGASIVLANVYYLFVKRK